MATAALASVLLGSGELLGLPGFERIAECHRRHVDLIRELIERAQSQGALRALHSERLSHILVGMGIQITRDALILAADGAADEGAEIVMDLFLNGAACK